MPTPTLRASAGSNPLHHGGRDRKIPHQRVMERAGKGLEERQSVAAKVQDREGLAGYSGSSWLSESNTSSSFPTLILLGAWLRKTFRSMQHGSLIDSRGEHRLRKNKLWFYVPQMAS